MQLLVTTVAVGAAVSMTTHAILSRVGTRHASITPGEWAPMRSSSNRDAARELAASIGLDPSRIVVMSTENSEVHCSLRADPIELLELAKAAEAGIDQAFRERHRWTDLRVYLHLEA